MVRAISKLQLLDIVAIKEDLPNHNLLAGQVGTIVEFLAPEVYEVEFSDDDGQTYAMLPLHSSQLLKLKYKYTPENTPVCNHIYQYGQGDNVAGDKIAGDKVAGDKVDKSQTRNFSDANLSGVIPSQFKDNTSFSDNEFKQINNANTAELLKLISSMRETAEQFPEDIREGIIIDIEDIETEIQKPENQWNKNRLKQRLKGIVATVTAIGVGIAGVADFANTAIDLGQKMGIELKLPPGR